MNKKKDPKRVQNSMFQIVEPDEDQLLAGLTAFYQAMGLPISVESLTREWSLVVDLTTKDLAKNFVIIPQGNTRVIGFGGLFFQGNSCWISYMGIETTYQRRGLGKQLFQQLLDEARQENFQSFALYATEKGKSVYTNFGFQPHYRAQTYELNAPTNPLTNSILVKESDSFPAWVWPLDKKASGFDRSQFLTRHLILQGKLLLVKDQGYGLIHDGTLGPVIAKTSEIAKAIISQSYNHGARNIKMPAPERHSPMFFGDLNLYRERLGFDNIKMTWGPSIQEDLNLIYGIRGYSSG